MLALEMVSVDIPDSECHSIVQIYKKVSSRIRLVALGKVTDHDFFEKLHDTICNIHLY